MKTMLTRRATLAAFLSMAAMVPGFAHGQGTEKFKTSTLAIVGETGRHDFAIELAMTDRQQQQGLMFRRSLAQDGGMLFDYGMPTRITMWMKNTLIPLDMIFIGADGKIVDIAERAIPLSEEIIPTRRPARAVLEINGGTVARLGIKIGDRVEAEALGLKP